MAQRGMGSGHHKMEMVVWQASKKGIPHWEHPCNRDFGGPGKRFARTESGTLFACFIGVTNDISYGQNGNLDVVFASSALIMGTGNIGLSRWLVRYGCWILPVRIVEAPRANGTPRSILMRGRCVRGLNASKGLTSKSFRVSNPES
jgi:hypothetical protein